MYGPVAYAVWTGTGWQTEIVDSSGYCLDTDLAYDSSDHPVVAYNQDVLKFAAWDGLNWNPVTVDSAKCKDVSLVLDSFDFPVISYISERDGGPPAMDEIKLARWDGTAWDVQMVDTANRRGFGPVSLALDNVERPHICYYKQSTGLTYVRWDGAAWIYETVDEMGYFSSLAVDAAGHPWIAYSSIPPDEMVVDDNEIRASLRLAWRSNWSYSILRGEAPSVLEAVADTILPWIDPDPVLLDTYPALLYYKAEGKDRIYLEKNTSSITMH